MPLVLPPLKLGKCGTLMKKAVDALSDSEKKDRDAIYKALGSAIEKYTEEYVQKYVQKMFQQVVLVIPPLPGLGTSIPGVSGGPTLPGPAPVPIPPGNFK